MGDGVFMPNHAMKIHDREAKGDVKRRLEKKRGKHKPHPSSTCLLIAASSFLSLSTTNDNIRFTCNQCCMREEFFHRLVRKALTNRETGKHEPGSYPEPFITLAHTDPIFNKH